MERRPASATESDPASGTKSGRVRAERRITNATRKSQTRLANAPASVSKRSQTSATARRAASAAENEARKNGLAERRKGPRSAIAKERKRSSRHMQAKLRWSVRKSLERNLTKSFAAQKRRV